MVAGFAVLELVGFDVAVLDVGFVEVKLVNVLVEITTDVMLLVVVLQVGCIFLLVQDAEAEKVTVLIWLPDLEVLVQLHDTMVVALVEVDVTYEKAGAGTANAVLSKKSVSSIQYLENMIKERLNEGQ